MDPKLNSGVQIRSQCFDRETTSSSGTARPSRSPPTGCMAIRSRSIRTCRARTAGGAAGIYDEARRGWLYPAAWRKATARTFTEQGRKIFKQGDWNHVRVEAIGDSIKTSLNGTPCAVHQGFAVRPRFHRPAGPRHRQGQVQGRHPGALAQSADQGISTDGRAEHAER